MLRDGTDRTAEVRWDAKGLVLELDGVPESLAPLADLPGVRDWVGSHGYALRLPRPVLTIPSVREAVSRWVPEAVIQQTIWSGWTGTTWRDFEVWQGLHEHQRVGADFLRAAGQAVLGDQMGLGKTRAAAAAAHEVALASVEARQQVLIVAPKHLRRSWQDQLRAAGIVTDPERFVVLEGTTRKRGWREPHPEGATWYFVHYDVIAHWAEQLALVPWTAVLFDEIHAARNWRAKRTRAAATAASRAFYRFGLTGTPVVNRVADLWGILAVVLGRGILGRKDDFVRRYGGGVWNGAAYEETRPTNVEELSYYLESLYVRRTYDDVLAIELPPLQREAAFVSVTASARKRSAQMAKRLRERGITPGDLLSGGQDIVRLTEVVRARQAVSIAKVGATCDLVEAALLEGQSVLVFVWQRERAEMLRQQLDQAMEKNPRIEAALSAQRLTDGEEPCVPVCVMVHGGLSARQREQAIEAFQQRGGVLVATYGTLAEGVTLTRASRVVLHDLEWLPATLLQAEGRAYRIGQKKPVKVTWVIGEGTFDEQVARALALKAERMAAAGDAGARLAIDGLGLVDDGVDEEALLKKWPESADE